MNKQIFLILSFVLIVTCPVCFGLEGYEPHLKWKEGDSWTLDIEYYISGSYTGGKIISAPRGRYTMQVKVAGSRRLGSTECWLLSFVPGNNLPVNIDKLEPVLLISKHDGTAMSYIQYMMYNKPKHWDSYVESEEVINAGGRKFPERVPPYGYPAYFMLPKGETDETYWGKRRKFGKKRKKGFSRSYRIAEKDINGERHIEMTRTYAGSETKRIKQRWVKNAKWWSECEEIYHGYKRLHVWLKE